MKREGKGRKGPIASTSAVGHNGKKDETPKKKTRGGREKERKRGAASTRSWCSVTVVRPLEGKGKKKKREEAKKGKKGKERTAERATICRSHSAAVEVGEKERRVKKGEKKKRGGNVEIHDPLQLTSLHCQSGKRTPLKK